MNVSSKAEQGDILSFMGWTSVERLRGAKTGQPEVLLQDEGYLTDLRTALAGAVVAKYMAPRDVKAIGIIRTGMQARLQLELLSWVTDCQDVFVYGRTEEKVLSFGLEHGDILNPLAPMSAT